MDHDPVLTNPDLYRVVFENERVRVLAYHDRPGARTVPHSHPDSVMVTLTSFRRRLESGDRQADVELQDGEVRWLQGQTHVGENIGDTESRVIFVELKEEPGASTQGAALGPSRA